MSECPSIIEVVAARTVVEVLPPASPPVVIEVGIPGPPGPPGPAGGTAFTRPAPAPLSALKVVWEDEAGNVAPLDYQDGDHIDLISGITTTAASEPGQSVTVQRAGPLDASGLGLVPGPVWLGIAGALTQTPPADGYLIQVGAAVSATRIVLDPQPPIFLEE